MLKEMHRKLCSPCGNKRQLAELSCNAYKWLKFSYGNVCFATFFHTLHKCAILPLLKKRSLKVESDVFLMFNGCSVLHF